MISTSNFKRLVTIFILLTLFFGGLFYCIYIYKATAGFFAVSPRGRVADYSRIGDPTDLDEFEVDPSTRWTESTSGSGITESIENHYLKISSGGSVTGSRLYSRPLRTSKGVFESKVMFTNDFYKGTGSYGKAYIDNDCEDPSWYNYTNDNGFQEKWVDATDLTMDQAGNLPSQSSAQAHQGTYSLNGFNTELYSSDTIQNVTSDYRVELWVYYDTDTATSLLGEWIGYTNTAGTGTQPFHVYLNYDLGLSDISFDFVVHNSTGDAFSKSYTASAGLGTWIGLRIQQNSTGHYSFYVNENDVGWSEVGSGNCGTPLNLAMYTLLGMDENLYVDDLLCRTGFYGDPAGDIKIDFYLANEDGDRVSFEIRNTAFYFGYTRTNRLYNIMENTNVSFEKNQWYYFSMNFDIKRGDVKFSIFDNDNSRISEIGIDKFYNITTPPSIFSFKNLSAGFHYQVDQYDYAQTMLIDYISAPFVIFNWIETFYTGASSSDFQSAGAYGVAVNGSTASTDKIVYYTNYVDHFQAYSGMIKAELDEANDSADYLKSQIDLYSVNSAGSTGAGKLATIVLTVSGFGGGKADLEIKITTPATSIIKNFADVSRGTVGFLFWRNPSSNKLWVKASLWDETLNLNKTLLQLANPLPESDTNEYMIQQMFTYSSNDSLTNGQTLIFDTDLVRSLSEIQEPTLPWPDKPPVPPPKMDWFTSVISFVIGIILSPFFWLFDNVIAPLIEWILDAINDLLGWVIDFIFEWLQKALDWVLTVLSDLVDAFADLIFTWWDSNNFPNVLALIEDILGYFTDLVGWLIDAVSVFIDLMDFFVYVPLMFLIVYWIMVLIIPAASADNMSDFIDGVIQKLGMRFKLSIIIGIDIPIAVIAVPATLIELLVVTV